MAAQLDPGVQSSSVQMMPSSPSDTIPEIWGISVTWQDTTIWLMQYNKSVEWFEIEFCYFNNNSLRLFLAATKQLYKWYFPSVCLSVRPSVRLSVRPSVTPFWLCSHHRIIMKFSGVITSDRSDVHAKGQGQRSRSQRSRPNFTVSGL